MVRYIVDIDVNNRDALSQIARIERELDGISDEEIQVKVDTDQAQRSVGALEGAVEDLGDDLSKVANEVPILGGAVDALKNPLVGVAAGMTAAALAANQLTQEAEDYTVEIYKQHQATGLSIRLLQELAVIEQRSAISKGKLAEAAYELNERYGDFVLFAGGEGKEAFAALELSLEELGEATPEERFLLLFESLRKVEDQAYKTTLADKAFAGAHEELLPLLDASRQSLSELSKGMEDYGFLTDEQISKNAQLIESYKSEQAEIDLLKVRLGSELLPIKKELISTTLELTTEEGFLSTVIKALSNDTLKYNDIIVDQDAKTKALAEITHALTLREQEQERTVDDLGSQYEDLGGQLRSLETQIDTVTDAVDDNTTSFDTLSGAKSKATERATELKEQEMLLQAELEELGETIDTVTYKQEGLTNAVSEHLRKVAEAIPNESEYNRTLAETHDEIQELTPEQQKLNAERLAAAREAAAAKDKEEELKSAVDSTSGAMKSGASSASTYGSALQGVASDAREAASEIESASKAVQSAYQQWKSAASKSQGGGLGWDHVSGRQGRKGAWDREERDRLIEEAREMGKAFIEDPWSKVVYDLTNPNFLEILRPGRVKDSQHEGGDDARIAYLKGGGTESSYDINKQKRIEEAQANLKVADSYQEITKALIELQTAQGKIEGEWDDDDQWSPTHEEMKSIRELARSITDTKDKIKELSETKVDDEAQQKLLNLALKQANEELLLLITTGTTNQEVMSGLSSVIAELISQLDALSGAIKVVEELESKDVNINLETNAEEITGQIEGLQKEYVVKVRIEYEDPGWTPPGDTSSTHTINYVVNSDAAADIVSQGNTRLAETGR